ncbi:hypothetical protein V8J88_07795 [Massilia sp. W12]|uniref:hypothetical protein n=1 Tax=Massilia sp. W12 TaxID=3126507 RepID=UPI0030D4D059
MNNYLLFGIAIGLATFSWSLSRIISKNTPTGTLQDWKNIVQNLILPLLVACSMGTAGSLFWSVGESGVSRTFAPEKRGGGDKNEDVRKHKNVSSEIPSSNASVAEFSSKVASAQNNPAPAPAPAPASASASASTSSPPKAGDGEQSSVNGKNLPPETWLAIASFVLAIITGVYLVAIQNTLQAGKELVKEMAEQRKQIEKELNEIAAIKRSRSQIVGGIAECLECTVMRVSEITDQLQEFSFITAGQRFDFVNIKNGLDNISSELSWVSRANTFLSLLEDEKYNSADTSAEQINLFLGDSKSQNSLFIFIFNDLHEQLRKLRREKPDMFGNKTPYPNFRVLLDSLSARK